MFFAFQTIILIDDSLKGIWGKNSEKIAFNQHVMISKSETVKTIKKWCISHGNWHFIFMVTTIVVALPIKQNEQEQL